MKQDKSSLVKFLAIPGILLLIATPLAVPDTLAGTKDVVKAIWQLFSGFLEKLWTWAKQFYLEAKDLAEERKSIIKKEFEKEEEQIKGGIKQQLLKIPKSLWERIKELIK